MLLPPHEYILSLRDLRNTERALASLLLERSEGREFAPVLKVDFVRRSPILVLGEECVFGSDDFALEVCGECWVVFRETCKGSVSIQA